MSNPARLPRFLRPESLSGYQNKVFAHLNQLERQRAQDAARSDSPFCVLQGTQSATRDLNRYSDILPYKHSQVLLAGGQGGPQSFINANRITAPQSLKSSLPPSFKGYIATQAPLPHTQSRFWRMAFEQNVYVIVCLTAVSEDRTRRAQKAERYWPLAGQTDEIERGLFVRNLDSVDDQSQVAYRHFELWDANRPDLARRPMLLVHYQGWPDHGVPTQSQELRDILLKIRAWKREQQQQLHLTLEDFGPMIVHCSAGCGRTGTFCVVDTALSVLEYIQYPHLAAAFRSSSAVEGKQNGYTAEDMYDPEGNRDLLYESLNSFRNERMLMVQTLSQYMFCYQVVRDLCE
ncbi:hypothetical protein EMPS_02237 [Entomortierella parvispora]|uniref:Uncharacterized protein n=1 Tax=Entomortierella parvispora TaxID=205924 RepID=A0A9P3H4F0_9FUNG|nr:hypothetical protein EMPS_02237 [Entomortierella parvispora]